MLFRSGVGEVAVLGEADGEHAGHPLLVLHQHVVEVRGHATEERRRRRGRRVAVDGRPPSAVELLVAGEVVLHHRLVQETNLQQV